MEPIDRRGFLLAAGAATATLAAAPPAAAQTSNPGGVFISTWDFGVEANRRAGEIFAGGGSLLDAVEKHGSQLQHLTTRQASLEDVFVNLTGRHLREQ